MLLDIRNRGFMDIGDRSGSIWCRSFMYIRCRSFMHIWCRGLLNVVCWCWCRNIWGWLMDICLNGLGFIWLLLYICWLGCIGGC